MDNQKRYQTKFYARTWMLWSSFIIIGILCVAGCVMGPLFLFGIIEPANGRPGYEGGIPMTIVGLCFLPITIVITIQLWGRQTPILEVYEEGLLIREITSLLGGNAASTVSGIFLVVLPIWALYLIITFQVLRKKTYQIPWTNVSDVQFDSSVLCIVGRPSNKEVLEYYETKIPVSRLFQYPPDAFGTSLKKVGEAVMHYFKHRDASEMLSSWKALQLSDDVDLHRRTEV